MKDGIFLIEMGKKIKTARKAKKMSLETLAERSGIDMSNIWFLEKGRRNAHVLTLKSIAEVLKIDLKDLI